MVLGSNGKRHPWSCQDVTLLLPSIEFVSVEKREVIVGWVWNTRIGRGEWGDGIVVYEWETRKGDKINNVNKISNKIKQLRVGRFVVVHGLRV